MCFFAVFMTLFVISKIFIAHRAQRDTSFKHEKVWFVKAVFSILFKFMSFTAVKKTGLLDFPRKRAPTEVKYLLTVCQILWNFTEENSRKFTVILAFPLEHAQFTIVKL